MGLVRLGSVFVWSIYCAEHDFSASVIMGGALMLYAFWFAVHPPSRALLKRR